MIQRGEFFGREFLIKRDDLHSFNGLNPAHCGGNKAYKLYFLLNLKFLHLASYGGNQSNAMLSLSQICKYKNAKFTYFTNEIPRDLGQNPIGNLNIALKNNMNLVELPRQFSSKYLGEQCRAFAQAKNALFVPQGAACLEAEIGIKILADEILGLNLEKPAIFCSAGTGTFAFFLQKNLNNIRVFTTPCVGNKDFLISQFHALESQKNTKSQKIINESSFPAIILPHKKLRFGKPDSAIFSMFLYCKNQGIEFDLLYDCVLWRAICDNILQFSDYKNLLFLHSGGILGNESQILRYRNLEVK